MNDSLGTYEYTHSAVICYSFNIRVHTQCCHLLLFCLCKNGQPFITAFYYLCSGSRAIFDLLWENIKFSVCFPRTAEMRAFYALHFREHFLQNLHTRYLNIIIFKNILRIVDKKGKAADGQESRDCGIYIRGGIRDFFPRIFPPEWRSGVNKEWQHRGGREFI